jgi:AcrR family transcriptional regulator
VSSGAPARARPGRPSTGARDRILDACLEVLKAEGYAGLTIAKVAARAGESKALVAYHFGSKQGVVAAAARELGRIITDDVLAGVAGARTVEEVVRGAADAIWRILERDPRLPRAYFDLNAVSVVEDEVRSVLREVKAGWREVVAGLLRDAGLDPQRVPAATVLVIAALEGFSLEWIERGDTPELGRARELFVSATVSALEPVRA